MTVAGLVVTAIRLGKEVLLEESPEEGFWAAGRMI
jgi:hypothetical protein